MTNKQRMRHEQIARVKAAAITQWFRSWKLLLHLYAEISSETDTYYLQRDMREGEGSHKSSV